MRFKIKIDTTPTPPTSLLDSPSRFLENPRRPPLVFAGSEWQWQPNEDSLRARARHLAADAVAMPRRRPSPTAGQ